MVIRLKRQKYLHTNKYQKRIVLLTLLPTLIIVIFVNCMMQIYHGELVNVILRGSMTEGIDFVNDSAGLILTCVWAFVVIVVVWSFALSRNLVGAFERIIVELDEVIEGKDREEIIARNNDDLAKNLLSRINMLIRHLPKPREKLK